VALADQEVSNSIGTEAKKKHRRQTSARAGGTDGRQDNSQKRFVMVRRERGPDGSDSRCCRGDEGRPLGAGVQRLASNQAVLLWPKRRWW
jgi:hypothetical protein